MNTDSQHRLRWKRALGACFHRTGLSVESLDALSLSYDTVRIPKRSGGFRSLSIPNPDLKWAQQQLLQTLLRFLPIHPATKGFARRRSTVDHAAVHCGKPYVLAMDIKDFFPSTTMERVRAVLMGFGWNSTAVESICRVVCHPEQGGLPQGAPTSPALSNIVNSFMDHRLTRLAACNGFDYSRYADDLAFSPNLDRHLPITTYRRDVRKNGTLDWVGENSKYIRQIGYLKQGIRRILSDCGYSLHSDKTRVLTQGRRQLITGVVVNDRCALPRVIRRRLRAAEHRQRMLEKYQAGEWKPNPKKGQVRPLGHSAVTVAGEAQAMSAEQLQGWQSYHRMVAKAGHRQATERALASLQGVWIVVGKPLPSRFPLEPIPQEFCGPNDVKEEHFVIEGSRLSLWVPQFNWIRVKKRIGELRWRHSKGVLVITDPLLGHFEVTFHGKGEVGRIGSYRVTGNDLRLAWCRNEDGTAEVPQIDGHLDCDGNLVFGGSGSRFTCIRLKTKPDALYQWGRVSPQPAPPS